MWRPTSSRRGRRPRTLRERVDLTTVRAYLFTIARNLYLQQLRQKRRGADLDLDVPDPEPGPDRQAGARHEDLRPLYISGEVSADTKTLVEAYLRLDADPARAIAAAWALELPPTPAPAPTGEKATLDETRRLLKQKTDTMVVAILFSVLPFVFTFNGDGITFFLIRDKPIVGAAWRFTAATLWIWQGYLRRRLGGAGL